MNGIFYYVCPVEGGPLFECFNESARFFTPERGVRPPQTAQGFAFCREQDGRESKVKGYNCGT